MKKNFYSLFLILAINFSASSQWQRVNLAHQALDAPYDVEVPNDHTVWASLWNLTDPQNPYTPFYYRTADGGANWDYGFVNAPTGYVISSLAPIDEDTCYAIMVNLAVGTGGGIFKTTDGGNNWNQLAVGQIFNSSSFPDFIYFWNAKQGVAVGDANGPGTPYMEIYTTKDAGATWKRVARANMPPDIIFGITNSYYVVGDRMWFQATDLGSVHQIWRSDDRGFHWQEFPINISETIFNDLAFTDSLNGVVVGFSDTSYVLNTKDGGKTWSAPLNYSGVLYPTYVEAIPGTTTLVSTNPFANAPAGSSYSIDNGKTWTVLDEDELHTNLKFLSASVGWSGEAVLDANSIGGMFRWTGFPCDRPRNLTAISITSSSAKIKWGAVSGAASYTLQGRVQGTTTWTTITVKDTSFKATGLAAATTYEIRVRAVCTVVGVQSRYTQIATFTTTGFPENSVTRNGVSAITISPNPAQDAFKIRLNSSVNGRISIYIIDAVGKKIFSETRNASVGLNEFLVDISRLSKGVYLVQVETNDQKVVTKLVKE